MGSCSRRFLVLRWSHKSMGRNLVRILQVGLKLNLQVRGEEGNLMIRMYVIGLYLQVPPPPLPPRLRHRGSQGKWVYILAVQAYTLALKLYKQDVTNIFLCKLVMNFCADVHKLLLNYSKIKEWPCVYINSIVSTWNNINTSCSLEI